MTDHAYGYRLVPSLGSSSWSLIYTGEIVIETFDDLREAVIALRLATDAMKRTGMP